MTGFRIQHPKIWQLDIYKKSRTKKIPLSFALFPKAGHKRAPGLPLGLVMRLTTWGGVFLYLDKWENPWLGQGRTWSGQFLRIPRLATISSYPLSNHSSAWLFTFHQVEHQTHTRSAISLGIYFPWRFLCDLKFILNTFMRFSLNLPFVVGTSTMNLATSEKKTKFFCAYSRKILNPFRCKNSLVLIIFRKKESYFHVLSLCFKLYK